ncbi:MAG: hypothetical protein HYW77_01440 [Parcubacteria group bacterium]|nr:hypothetical protein [Parcubacteria group bacterium]
MIKIKSKRKRKTRINKLSSKRRKFRKLRKNKMHSRKVRKGKVKNKKKQLKIQRLLKKESFKRVKPKKSKKRRIKFKKKISFKSISRYGLNSNFIFFDELRNLVLKSSPSSRSKMIKRITSLGRVKLAVVSGIFLNLETPAAADLLVVGEDIDRRRLRTFLRDLESEVGTEVAFSLMDGEEFEYRRRMFDRFLRVLLEGPHEVLIDKIGL